MPGSDRRIEHLQAVYPYDPDRQLFTIPVQVARLEDLFNNWDPSPTPRRDLSPDLRAYLLECSEEIPLRYPVALGFTITGSPPEPDRQAQAEEGIRNYFSYEARIIGQKVRRSRLRSLQYALVFVACMGGAMLLNLVPGESVLLSFPREGLTIGSWVFMWEAISETFIHAAGINRSIRLLRRLQKAPIWVVM